MIVSGLPKGCFVYRDRNVVKVSCPNEKVAEIVVEAFKAEFATQAQLQPNNEDGGDFVTAA
ncbi:hypothetical protein HY413_01690 [Candidatus Kaiserbacteria bacterium]|nr:hypothetical protein [Candidatus Kaiserbacteria bacterium]